MINSKQVLFLFPLCLSVSCGGDSGGNGTGTTRSEIYYGGKFYDSLVTGIQYNSRDRLEVIGEDGWYDYAKNKPIAFYVGDIKIGEVIGRENITPLTLAGALNTSDDYVLNISRFLQTSMTIIIYPMESLSARM